MDLKKKQIFISYNQKDKDVASQVWAALHESDFVVWIDLHQIKPGDRIADKITEGLSASDYYVVLISENANKSTWVKRELSLAFDLSSKNRLTIVPILLDQADLPFELNGLLYLDFRKSLKDGLQKLIEFFRTQLTKVSELEIRTSILKADNQYVHQRLGCEASLRELRLGDLRSRLTDKLSRSEIAVIWFDIFERKMEDEAPGGDISMCCVELIDRARRRDLLWDLISTICRNHPYVGK